RVGERGASLATSDRSRLSRLLLHGARRYGEQANRGSESEQPAAGAGRGAAGFGLKAIARLPLFRGLERGGRERWRGLLARRQPVQDEGGERLLTALFPDQDPTEFASDGRIFVLDESERALLGELLELGFRQPRRRVEARRGPLELLRELPSLLRGHGLVAALRPGGRAILDAELAPEERSLLVQLRAQLEGCEIAMCT